MSGEMSVDARQVHCGKSQLKQQETFMQELNWKRYCIIVTRPNSKDNITAQQQPQPEPKHY